MDVKLGPMRIGHLKIRDGDNPALLAGSFCRVFGLDDIACSVLANAARKSMLSHGVPIGNAKPVVDNAEGDGEDEMGREDDSYSFVSSDSGYEDTELPISEIFEEFES